MTKQELFELKIHAYDKNMHALAKAQWNAIAKPLDGLGDLEEMVCQLAAIQKKINPQINQRTLLVFCADNGIVARGVTQSEQDITQKVAMALGANKSTSNCMAQPLGVLVLPIDVGINCKEKLAGVRDAKIAMGTRDFLVEPSMTEEQVLAAISIGISCVEELVASGVNLIATGEMGIGNTTTTAAVLAAVLETDSDTIVGRGAGLNDEKLAIKKQVVKEGIAKYKAQFDACEDARTRCFEILRCLGGLDLAALCGVYLGGALWEVPIVIDGVISATAALLAERMHPGTKDYMFASHSGREKGTKLVLEALGKRPILNGNMALGEGTGSLLMIPLLDNALHLYRNGSRFDDNNIEAYERF